MLVYVKRKEPCSVTAGLCGAKVDERLVLGDKLADRFGELSAVAENVL